MNRLALVLCFALATPLLAQSEPPKDPNAKIKKRLDEQKVNINFDATPLQEALDVMGDLMETSIVVDPSAHKIVAEGRVTLTVRDLLTKNALGLIEANAKLEHHVFHGVILITKKDEKVAEPEIKPTESMKKSLATKRVTVNFNETPLSEVVPFLSDLSGDNFKVSPKVDAENVKLSFQVRDVSLGDAVAIICRLTGLTLGVDSGVNKFKPAEKTPDLKKP